MKKNILLITLIVLLGCFLFVSCDSEAAAPQTDELVKVAFVESTSKALTQNIPAFEVASHYWKYTAVKKDGSTLTTGATGTTHDVAQAKWVALDSNNSPKQGLSENNTPYKVINFSRGLWEFKLYGYSDAAGTKLVYTGTSSTVALTQDYHQVSVNVSRDKTSGTGTLVIDKDITINNASETAYANLSSAVVRTYEIKKYNSSNQQYEALNPSVTGTLGSEDETIENLAAGDYQITITYADSTYTYGSGSANFVIYSNVTTTITGSVSETTTYAEFEAVATVINVTSSSRSFDSTSTDSVEIKYENSTSDAVTAVSTTISNEVAQALLATAIEEEGAVTEVTGKDVSNNMVLSLSVSTEESTATSATYNIDMNYTLTTTVSLNNTVESTTVYNGNTKTLSNYSTTPLNIGLKGLTSVNIDHDGLAMVAVDNLDTLNNITVDNTQGYTENTRSDAGDTFYAGFMFYDSNAGIVYLRTRSYSPFTLTYEVPKYVASIGTTFYTTLQGAITAAQSGDTIVLLDDITSTDGYLINKTLSLDTNGKTVTVETGASVNNRAFKITSGTFTVYGGGIIDARGTKVPGATKSEAASGTGCYGAFRAEVGTTLNLKDLTLKNYRPWGLNVKILGATASLDNVNIISEYGGGIEVTDDDGADGNVTGSAVLRNCVMNQTAWFDWCSVPVSVSGNSTVDVYSTSYTGEYGVYVFSSGGTINIYGGVFRAEKDVLITSYDSKYGNDSVINVYNGEFYGSINKASNSSKEFINIYGGTFDHNPTAYVPTRGYDITHNETSPETWTVSKRTTGVAKIVNSDFDGSDLFFDSLQDAIDAANNEEEVVLLSDITLHKLSSNDNVAVSIKKSITLNGAYTQGNETVNHIITTDAGRGIWIDSAGVTVEIKNITVQGTAEGSSNPLERAFQINSDCNGVSLKLTGCKGSCLMYALNVCYCENVTITVANSELEGWAAINTWSNGYSITVTDSILTGKNYTGDTKYSFATVCLEGDTTHETTLGSANTSVTITGGAIKALDPDDNRTNSQYLFGFNSNCSNNVLTITNCELTVGPNNGKICYDSGSGNSWAISGGSLNGNNLPVNVDAENLNIAFFDNCVAYEYLNNDVVTIDGYWNLNNLLSKNAAATNPYFCDGEWLRFTENVVLTASNTVKMRSTQTGFFGFKLGEYTLTAENDAKLTIPVGVTVVCDKDITDLLKAPDGLSSQVEKTTSTVTGYNFEYKLIDQG